MFTDDEYQKFPHWGHSTPWQALEIVRDAHAKKLILFHHAPNRTDEDLDRMLADTVERAADTGVAIDAARQGQTLVIE